MPRSVSQILYGQRTRRRFRSSGMDTDEPVALVVDPVLAAKAALEEVAGAMTNAGVFNIGTIEARPKRIEVRYRCPAVNCAQHGPTPAGKVDNQFSGTPCPVFGVLTRLVNAGVIEKVTGTAGASAWGLDTQPCKHTRSKLRVEFIALRSASGTGDGDAARVASGGKK